MMAAGCIFFLFGQNILGWSVECECKTVELVWLPPIEITLSMPNQAWPTTIIAGLISGVVLEFCVIKKIEKKKF